MAKPSGDADKKATPPAYEELNTDSEPKGVGTLYLSSSDCVHFNKMHCYLASVGFNLKPVILPQMVEQSFVHGGHFISKSAFSCCF
jgi:hypothetical protein